MHLICKVLIESVVILYLVYWNSFLGAKLFKFSKKPHMALILKLIVNLWYI